MQGFVYFDTNFSFRDANFLLILLFICNNSAIPANSAIYLIFLIYELNGFTDLLRLHGVFNLGVLGRRRKLVDFINF